MLEIIFDDFIKSSDKLTRYMGNDLSWISDYLNNLLFSKTVAVITYFLVLMLRYTPM